MSDRSWWLSVASTVTTNSRASLEVASSMKAGKATKTTASGKGRTKRRLTRKSEGGRGKGAKKAGGKGGKVKDCCDGSKQQRAAARAGVAFPFGRIPSFAAQRYSFLNGERIFN
ncbi:hypothetical protein niasHT_016109 [Heterodera trifolii]|uniref:Uncharacterized protein n=1 Tax=Heterodera trifolii TaxID=157864 RepID=A0ABD2LB26_9BILA